MTICSLYRLCILTSIATIVTCSFGYEKSYAQDEAPYLDQPENASSSSGQVPAGPPAPQPVGGEPGPSGPPAPPAPPGATGANGPSGASGAASAAGSEVVHTQLKAPFTSELDEKEKQVVTQPVPDETNATIETLITKGNDLLLSITTTQEQSRKTLQETLDPNLDKILQEGASAQAPEEKLEAP